MEQYDVLAAMESCLRKTGIYKLDGTTLVDAELAAYGAGFQFILDDYQILAKEIAVQTAESFGLTMREALIEQSFSHLPLEKRREQLLQNLAVGNDDYTVSAMEQQLDSLGITAHITERTADNAITVTVTDISRLAVQSRSVVQALAKIYLPAHLYVTYDFSQVNCNSA